MNSMVGEKVKLIKIENITPFDNENINIGDVGVITKVSSKSFDRYSPIEVLFQNGEIMWCSKNEINILNQ